VRPVLKWAGGKIGVPYPRSAAIPQEDRHYTSPSRWRRVFLRPRDRGPLKRAVLSARNPALSAVYGGMKKDPPWTASSARFKRFRSVTR